LRTGSIDSSSLMTVSSFAGVLIVRWGTTTLLCEEISVSVSCRIYQSQKTFPDGFYLETESHIPVQKVQNYIHTQGKLS
jgi:hypothetical protein